MTHSNLTQVVIHSPNGYFPRSGKISKITIHHMAGVLTAEQCGYVFQNPSRQASSNYGIGNDGKIACYLEEENGPWTSSSYSNDNQAITMEVSNSYAGGDWPISDAAWNSMISLCADICKRYGIEPYYDGTPNATFTEHRMFAPTGCPGDYIHARMYKIVSEVKAAMNGSMSGEWVLSEKSGKWWYRYSDGSWPANKWEKINDKWYYFDADGWMVTGWISWNGSYYYCQPETQETGTNFGYMVTGWLTDKGKKYYLDPDEDGKMITGFKLIKSKWYCFDSTGALIKQDSRITVSSKTGSIKIS